MIADIDYVIHLAFGVWNEKNHFDEGRAKFIYYGAKLKTHDFSLIYAPRKLGAATLASMAASVFSLVLLSLHI